ncbi:hypothetical protein DKX38_026486 [Salix brachista]|uniref:Uncharacterized protein n=1 Tax=Salix brachista TaxID=2182728 RepID=A0A5N5J9L8_9ROSI|nr:hypothetical protein DKX38_026486 [Salix brachista]
MHDGVVEEGTFEGTSNLRTGLSKEAIKSISEVHAESEHAEIKKEKHIEVAVSDLVAEENQNKKTIDATEVVHDELKNEELAKQDTQQFKEGKEDTENCKPINLGEETTKESHQIYDLKAEKSHEDKMENEIQNEEVSNESREYLHKSAVENETINGSFPDEALVKNAEDMGTKLQVENRSDEKNSGNDGRTETAHVKEVEIEVDEHPSATKTTENTCSQKEETKEQEECGLGNLHDDEVQLVYMDYK